MNLYLIISGNLTGFSHFYASAGAKDFYAQSKIDFDFRNHLTFLRDGQKAYAVSFTDKMIAVSLVTRVLDSFRRPGVLNMTLLLPRKYKVSAKDGLQGGAALYQLLNEVNDMFYQRNFLNGMMNQNGAVLMQDYYSSILEKYQLVPDPKQRDVNAHINVALAKNNIGYIAAAESDIPLYLESLCRENYEGYHHVFLASDAPQNINESPVEEVFYPVRYTSNMEAGKEYSLPKKVRMSDKIDPLPSLQGYLAFNQDYTYEQIFQGACKQITPQLRNDVIYLSYQFDVEQRLVTFVFQFGSSPIDITEILPVKFCIGDNVHYLPNKSFVFSGKEIYQPIRLICENEKYEIVPGAANIDLSRYPSKECTVYVPVQLRTIQNSHQSLLEIKLLPSDGIFTIKIIYKTGEARVFYDVKQNWQSFVPGSNYDWRFEISSDQYETIYGNFSQKEKLIFKKKSEAYFQTNSDFSSQSKYPVQVNDSGELSDSVYDGEVKKQLTINKFIKDNLVLFSFLSVAVLALLGLGGYFVFNKLTKGYENEVYSEITDKDYRKVWLRAIVNKKELTRDYLLDSLGLKCEAKYDKSRIMVLPEEKSDSLIYTFAPKDGIPDSLYNNVIVTLALVYKKDTIFKYSDIYCRYEKKSEIPFNLNIFYYLKSIEDALDGGLEVDKNVVKEKLRLFKENPTYTNGGFWSETDLYKKIKSKIGKQESSTLEKEEGGEDKGNIKNIEARLNSPEVSLTDLTKNIPREINKIGSENEKNRLNDKVENLKNVIKRLREGKKPTERQLKMLSQEQKNALNFDLNPKEKQKIENYWKSCEKNSTLKKNIEKIESISDFNKKVKDYIKY